MAFSRSRRTVRPPRQRRREQQRKKPSEHGRNVTRTAALSRRPAQCCFVDRQRRHAAGGAVHDAMRLCAAALPRTTGASAAESELRSNRGGPPAERRARAFLSATDGSRCCRRPALRNADAARSRDPSSPRSRSSGRSSRGAAWMPDAKRAQMSVAADEAVAVANLDHVAVAAAPAREGRRPSPIVRTGVPAFAT